MLKSFTRWFLAWFLAAVILLCLSLGIRVAAATGEAAGTPERCAPVPLSVLGAEGQLNLAQRHFRLVALLG